MELSFIKLICLWLKMYESLFHVNNEKQSLYEPLLTRTDRALIQMLIFEMQIQMFWTIIFLFFFD